MSDYIKREDAINAYCKACDYCNLTGGEGIDFNECPITKEFRKIQAADVVEQKHGKWIEDGYYDEPYVCSICGEPAPVKEEGSHDHVCTKYCYNCGARMDGDSDV